MQIENMQFCVIVVDGEFVDFGDPEVQTLRYEPLSWTEAVELARLSFMQGYQCVFWRVGEAE